MAETNLGVLGLATAVLQSATAAFAFGEVALLAAQPTLTQDAVLLAAATLAAERADLTGVGVVAACLAFTSVLVSLGSSFLLAALVLKLWARVGVRVPWIKDATTGASLVVGAVAAGVLAAVLPPWIYIPFQGVLVLAVHSHSSNLHDMIAALLFLFAALYLSVFYGRVGAVCGLTLMSLTISVLCGIQKALTRRTHRPKTGSLLLDNIVFFSGCVGVVGFLIGLKAGEDKLFSVEGVTLMLQSVLWVAFLSAGLLGADLGKVAMTELGPEAAGRIAVGAAVVISVALRVILQSSSSLGAPGCMGGALGAAAASGVSLAASSVAAKQAFQSIKSTLVVVGSVGGGAALALRGVALKPSLLTKSELMTVAIGAIGAFLLASPKGSSHNQANVRRGLHVGPQLMIRIGMETVTTAAAAIGVGALGAAALGTAALGRLGTVGVLVAIVWATLNTFNRMA